MATSLEFIKSINTTSNVSSLSLTDVFSSKYDHYQVHLNVDDVDSEVAIEFRMINLVSLGATMTIIFLRSWFWFTSVVQ